jgi:hypothetical protein
MGFNIQLGLPTYIAFNNTASGALTANTRKDIFSIDHPVTSAKRVRITRIAASWIATTALAGDLRVYLFKGVLQASAGTTITSVVKKTEFAAADSVCRLNPTITAATLIWAHVFGSVPATANSVLPKQILYDAPTNGRNEDFVLTEGAVEGFAIAIQSSAAINWTPFLEVEFTEE